jgi:hypothetical protein
MIVQIYDVLNNRKIILQHFQCILIILTYIFICNNSSRQLCNLNFLLLDRRILFLKISFKFIELNFLID